MLLTAIAFGADMIAGFPTEDEAMFARSMELVEECGLAQLHVFPYSARPGTPAALMPQLSAVILGLMFVGVGTFFAQAAATGFVGRAATADRGSASGIYLACYFFGGLCGSAALGQLFDYLGWAACVAGVGFSLALVERLLKAFPDTVVGLKDSSGDWENAKSYMKNFPGFEVFPSNEGNLLETLKLGGAGTISATANVNAAGMAKLFRARDTVEAATLQAEVAAVRQVIQKYPLMAATKAILAEFRGIPEWNVLRPPLTRMPEKMERELIDALRALNFSLT